jgi:putative heme-binding domain-containing protein
VRAYHLKPEGASYSAEQENIVQSSDNWFRPSDVCVAPDGSVFVADWYDPGVGGHGMGDIKMGRVYRLAPVGHKYAVPKVDVVSQKGFLAALGSPNLAVRYIAMARAQSVPYADAVKLFMEGEPEYRENDRMKTRVLLSLLQLATQHNDKDLLQSLARELALNTDPNRSPEATPLIVGAIPKGLLKHETPDTPAYCREKLLAARLAAPEVAKDDIYRLMKHYDGKDRHYLAAIGIAVGHHDEKRREIILRDFEKHFPVWNDRVANLVWELRPPQVVKLVKDRLLDPKLTVEQRTRIVDILATSPAGDAGPLVLKLLVSDVPALVRERALENLRQFLPGKWENLGKSDDFEQVVTTLLNQSTSREMAVALIGAARRSDKADRLLDLANNNKEPLPLRQAATVALGELSGNRPVEGLIRLLSSGAPELQPAVVHSLGLISRRPGEKKALQSLQQFLLTTKTQTARELAVVALSSGQAGSNWLLSQQAKKALSEDVLPTVGRLLRNSPYRNIQDAAVKAFPPPGKLDLKKLPSIAVLVARKGDAEKGKKLLADSVKSNLQCLKCHTTHGVGGYIGPDLSMIGKKASRENLFESILYPSKAIADQYVTWTIETNKGISVQGLLIEETTEIVILRDAEGRDTRVNKREIESRNKSLKSIMPEDGVAHLNADELVDLVEYLFTLKTPALSLDRWHIAGPFANGPGMAGLDRVFAPEKTIDLKATYEGKHGKITWREVKPTSTGYVDLAAFFADQSRQIVSYLMQEIESPVEQEATIVLGTDDGAKLWLNESLVFTSRLTRAASPDQDRVKVKLKRGTNRIVLKIHNGDNPHGFYFTMLSEHELKQAGKK